MIRPLRLCVLVAVLAGTWLGGCGYFLDLVPEEKGLPLVSRPVAEEMLRTLKEREAKATSLRAVLDLTVWHGGRRQYLQQVAVVERPALIRLETIGWAIRVEPSHLVRLLLGLPPLPIEIDKSAMFRPENEYAYLLRERESSYTQRLWVSADDLTLLRGELYDWRSLRLRFRYSPEGYGLFSLLLEEPSGRVVIEVSYRSYELNPELPGDLFTLPQPSGRARVVDLDTGQAPSLRLQ